MSGFDSIQLFGCTAIIIKNKIEVSVPNEDIGSKFVMKFSNAILDGYLSSLLIRLPNKEINITAQDRDNLKFEAQERTLN